MLWYHIRVGKDIVNNVHDQFHGVLAIYCSNKNSNKEKSHYSEQEQVSDTPKQNGTSFYEFQVVSIIHLLLNSCYVYESLNL